MSTVDALGTRLQVGGSWPAAAGGQGDDGGRGLDPYLRHQTVYMSYGPGSE